ncbi:hypothetical protein L0337_14580 [candidate division KSB1 bacterium]|nr:hypothetical protein [candidate division KSB1 bacterium]
MNHRFLEFFCVCAPDGVINDEGALRQEERLSFLKSRENMAGLLSI